MTAVVQAASRLSDWWGPAGLAAEAGITEAQARDEILEMHAAGLIESDVCGAGPDEQPVVAWRVIVRPPLTSAEVMDLSRRIAVSLFGYDVESAQALQDALASRLNAETTRKGQDRAGADVLGQLAKASGDLP